MCVGEGGGVRRGETGHRHRGVRGTKLQGLGGGGEGPGPRGREANVVGG